MRQGTLDNLGGPPRGRAHPWTWRGKRFKAAVAAVSIVSLFALTAILGTADRVSAATCVASLGLAASGGPLYQVGDTTTVTVTFTNTGSSPTVSQTVDKYTQFLSCPAGVTTALGCTMPDDTSVL